MIAGLSLFVVTLLGALGIHHFIKVRRGLRTGLIEGLMIGYWGKSYEREYEPEAFWVNVWIGFFAAALGAIAILYGVLIASIMISEYFGVPDAWP